MTNSSNSDWSFVDYDLAAAWQFMIKNDGLSMYYCVNATKLKSKNKKILVRKFK